MPNVEFIPADAGSLEREENSVVRVQAANATSAETWYLQQGEQINVTDDTANHIEIEVLEDDA